MRPGSLVTWVLALGATAATLAALLWPAEDLPRLVENVWDKLPHIGVFFVLTLTWLGTGLPRLVVLLILGVLIVGSEIAQSVLPVGRFGDVADGVADAVGVALAFVVVALLRRFGWIGSAPDPAGDGGPPGG